MPRWQNGWSRCREVAAATPVMRDSVSLVAGRSSAPALLLAGDPQALAQSAWFREDFSEASLKELSALITTATKMPTEEDVRIPLPTGSESIGVWVETSDLEGRELQSSVNTWARLSNRQGRYRNVSLGGFGGPDNVPPGGWLFLSGELPERVQESAEEWSLAAIFFTTSSFVKVTGGTMYVDEFSALGPGLPGAGP